DRNLFASMGGEVSLAATMPLGSLIPSVVLSIDLKNRKQFDAALDTLLSASHTKLEPLGNAGSPAGGIEIVTPDKGGQTSPLLSAASGLRISLLRRDDAVFVASNPSALAPIAAAGKAGRPDSIRTNPELAGLLADKSSVPLAVEVVDLKRIFLLSYNLISSLVPSVPRDSLPFDPALLPS